MRFSVIYSFDCGKRQRLTPLNPPAKQRRLWQKTEGDEGFDDYTALALNLDEGEKGRHRKWCGILNEEQFQDFLDHTYLRAEDVQTGGSLGAPGCGYGWSPAFSFSRFDDAVQNAYVTPLASDRELVAWLELQNEEWENPVPIPALLTDAVGQQYLFDGVAQAEAAQVEKSIREMFCRLWS